MSLSFDRAARLLAAAGLAFAMTACGGGSDDEPPAPPPPPTSIGPAGGTAAGPNGAQVVVPAGALAQATEVDIAQTGLGAPPLPAGVTAFGPVFALTPHGTAFSTPAALTLPFDAGTLPAGTRLALYKTTAGQVAWEPVANAAVSGATISGLISSFSFAQAVAEPVPDPGPSCDFRVRLGFHITGKVLDERGRPHIGIVRLRDRGINVGAEAALAGANEAGFFLLANAFGITSAGCPNRSYFIEVESKTDSGVKLYGELDVTSLFPVGQTGGPTDLDITATPVILSQVE